MGVVHVQIPEDLKRVIDRQIAEGRASSEADFLLEAARFYAAHLEVGGEIAAMVERADAEMAAGRYRMIATPEDSQALHETVMARLRVLLASDAAGR